MRIISSLKSKSFYAFSLLLAVMLISCNHGQSQKIPFNEKNALTHIRPYDTLVGYIETFKQVRNRAVENSITIDTADLPLAESFNRDAIIALLNAPHAKNIRIYLGKKPNGQLAFCILPVDSAGNDIAVQLVNTDKRTAIKIPGISTATAGTTSSAQGVEEGQRCPTLCSGKAQ